MYACVCMCVCVIVLGRWGYVHSKSLMIFIHVVLQMFIKYELIVYASIFISSCQLLVFEIHFSVYIFPINFIVFILLSIPLLYHDSFEYIILSWCSWVSIVTG